MKNEFNKYAKENKLDIELNMHLYTFSNSSNLGSDYYYSLDYLLNKGSTKYDIYFYDIIYSTKYKSYFMTLNDVLSEEHKSLYSSGIASKVCIFDGKWISLVNIIII